MVDRNSLRNKNVSILLLRSALFFFRIVQAFETATIILVSQENFTELTVVTENIALVAERVR